MKVCCSILGCRGKGRAESDWRAQMGENLVHLREAGVTENLLGVHFGAEAEWPSPELLMSAEYTAKMARHFASVGRAAKELGFRGVSIDVEYPYRRYELDHEIYTYEGYTVEDVLAGARAQGRAVMEAVLGEFPEAVLFVLPGELWARPIERAFQVAMLEVMAERDAPGGFHLGSEAAYTLYEYRGDPGGDFAVGGPRSVSAVFGGDVGILAAPVLGGAGGMAFPYAGDRREGLSCATVGR